MTEIKIVLCEYDKKKTSSAEFRQHFDTGIPRTFQSSSMLLLQSLLAG